MPDNQHSSSDTNNGPIEVKRAWGAAPFFRPRFTLEQAGGDQVIAEDLWFKCSRCKQLTYTREFIRNLRVCAKCGKHTRMRWDERIISLLDEGSFVELDPWL